VDAVCDDLSNLCMECGGGKLKNKGAQVKKTIAKASASVTFSSDASSVAKAKQSAPPTVRRSPPAQKPATRKSAREVVACRWGPRCTRPNCTFFHASPAANFALPDCSLVSRPCRFGAQCEKPTCPFWHPSPAAGQ
jgi:hypothetical protein